MPHIAIVDDEKVLVNSLSIALTDEGYSVQSYHNGTDFLSALPGISPDIVLLDLRLPDMSGLEILDRLDTSTMQVIMITAHGDMDSAINAMKSGAYDFINKPFELDEIILLAEKAYQEMRLTSEVEHLRRRNVEGLHQIVGESTPVAELLSQLERLGNIPECTVLVRGESGTGKELVAKAVHTLGGGEETPFIDINCSAFPEHLLESELFGHEKGAFTDAKEKKVGLIEMADGGTLFLDEIGEFPLPLQAKLLRFLESKTFRRVGGNREINVSVRIVAATNRDLERSIREGEFREDLYYRLNVIPVFVPPLREREGDVLLLAEHFLQEYAKRFGRERLILSGGVKNIFSNYAWPGNVRELKNLIERLVIMSANHVIDVGQLPPEMQKSAVSEPSVKRPFSADMNLDVYLAKIEYELIQDAIIKAKGVKSEAAKLLGISRHSLKRRLQRLGQEDE
ncbi:sigma-54-dependent transcriptional regulator [Limisalsivibrio acetivorans]|uniref:sigma-54-dependent transcriptional regulator n=1 Tax=Limisalsivibrio acetivorans TaxID=1304888 RepID=UPI0003B39230|nr:sigma-54 dependent transcriptional regulator [Limisalsivibrio acetivorans]